MPDPAALLREATTLVLATSDPEPWAAPVYFVHHRGELLFLSSPTSRHVTAGLASGRCAGSVFRDAADWNAIEGLQLEGSFREVPPGPAAEEALAAYAGRFPALSALLGGPPSGERLAALRVKLYAFAPERAFHVHNREGLQGRRPVPVPR